MWNFNLVFDRGTIFGLADHGSDRVDPLMSLAALVRWGVSGLTRRSQAAREALLTDLFTRLPPRTVAGRIT